MELHHLRYFAAVCEELHFGRAAQRLQMAQPPLSQRIKDLERELEVTLLLRHHSGLEVTEAGALLLEHARRVLDATDGARAAMRSIRPGTSGALRAGMPPDTNPHILQVIIEEFSQSTPGVRLRMHELTTQEQIGALRTGEIDIAVLRHPTGRTDLEYGPIVSRPLGVVMRAQDAPHAGALELADLAGRALVVFPRAMAPELYDELLGTCARRGFTPSAIAHARNPNFTAGMVLAGRGVHLNEEPWSELPEGLAWCALADRPLSWSSSVGWQKGQRSAVGERFGAAMLRGFSSGGHRPVSVPSESGVESL